MLKKHNLISLFVLSALASGAALAADKSAAMVNGVSIPQSRVDMRAEILISQGQPDSQDLRKAVRAELIDLELMNQEATKMGISRDNEVIQQIELAKQSIIAGAYMRDFAKKNPPSEADMKKEYENLKNALSSEKEFNARHVLVKTEQEAKNIIAQLEKGSSIASLASKSMDEGSKDNGGSLGWSISKTFVPPFAQALEKLNKGQYTKTPVQTQFGWHVIQVDDIRAIKVPEFESVKAQIQQRLYQVSIQKEMDRLAAKAKVE